jgi:hypothetical protein
MLGRRITSETAFYEISTSLLSDIHYKTLILEIGSCLKVSSLE